MRCPLCASDWRDLASLARHVDLKHPHDAAHLTVAVKPSLEWGASRTARLRAINDEQVLLLRAELLKAEI